MKIKKREQHRKKTFLTIVALILLVGLCGAYAYALLQSKPGMQKDADRTTSIDPRVEEHVKKGGGSGQDDASAASGGVIDTGGKNTSAQSEGLVSKSGNITLYTPVPNQLIEKSVSVKGASNTSMVYYRINDSARGMIGSGQLSVHNGYFSGDLSISTSAPQGSFEVYSLDDQGREINNISVDLKYS